MIFCYRFSHESSSSKPLKKHSGVWKFSQIRGVASKGAPLVSTTPLANFPPVSTTPAINLLGRGTTGVVDTGGKLGNDGNNIRLLTP